MNRGLGIIFIMLIVSFRFVGQELDTINQFDMEKMSKRINSVYHEGAPIISAESDKLYFFRTNHPDNRYGKEETQDIWYSEKKHGKWSAAEHMGNNLNRYKSNQVCAIINDGNSLLLAGGKTKKTTGFSISSKEGGDWGKPIDLDIPQFSQMNKGKYYGASMTNDRSVIVMYFSEKEGAKFSDLYVSKQVEGNKYTAPKKLALSVVQDDLSPFICSDNETMYYSSGRKGGLGDVDIWEVKRLDDTWENWSEPRNMGKPLNSKRFDAYFSTEQSFKNAYSTRAYMTLDGGSLDVWHFTLRPTINLSGKIYDQESLKGIDTQFNIKILKVGQIDLLTDKLGHYEKTLKDRGLYQFTVEAYGYDTYIDTLDLVKCKDVVDIIKNIPLKRTPKPVFLTGTVHNKKTNELLGAHIHIEHKYYDDIELNSDDHYGTFSADLHDIGKFKLVASSEGFYSETVKFEVLDGDEPLSHHVNVYLSPKERPIVLSGHLTDMKTGKGIKGEIQYIAPSGKKGVFKTHGHGAYKEELPEPGTYKLYTAVQGYMANNDTISVYVRYDDQSFVKDIELEPIEVGASVRLNEIYFDFDKETLKPESFPELERVVEFMRFNNTVVVELSGHTDSKGTDSYNLDLSQRRAEAVVNYLIEKGVAVERLTPVGYGETKPAGENDSDEGRAYNRRVEFTILKV